MGVCSERVPDIYRKQNVHQKEHHKGDNLRQPIFYLECLYDIKLISGNEHSIFTQLQAKQCCECRTLARVVPWEWSSGVTSYTEGAYSPKLPNIKFGVECVLLMVLAILYQT